MRRLIIILEAGFVLAGAALAQSSSSGDNSSAPQLPVGQVFKQFEFPAYEAGKLKYTLYATEAKGVTLNRADTSDLKIQIYDNGAVTTTITSPRADLFVAEQRMRTKNTVQIERTDMTATSQVCDFDVKNKMFVMRNNVRVVLKHFDMSGQAGASQGRSTETTTATPAPAAADSTPAPATSSLPVTPSPSTSSLPVTPPPSTSSLPVTPPPAAPAADMTTPAPVPASSQGNSGDAQVTSPGNYTQTNSAPIPPSSSDSK